MPATFKSNNLLFSLWMTFYQSYNSVLKCEEKEFVKAGISLPQHFILVAIKNSSGAITPGKLAKWYDRNAYGISKIIARMEEDGLIMRVKDLKDRRLLRLVITLKGEKVLARGSRIELKLMRELLGELSESEVDFMVDKLDMLRHTATMH
jgi:DNA-binding MarR family transcriptional regulator